MINVYAWFRRYLPPVPLQRGICAAPGFVKKESNQTVLTVIAPLFLQTKPRSLSPLEGQGGGHTERRSNMPINVPCNH